MKIAIQGHTTRGKEIIQILESLGGINEYCHKGQENFLAYYIYESGNIGWADLERITNEYKLYTLEEFEKEFPFKVGDKVIHKEFNDLFEVIAFNPELTYPYKIKGVCEFNTKGYVLAKWQPKMKEERFVTLTLDKAKEWYKKGGELREITLQAFSEKELNILPRNWEEFCNNYPRKKGESYVSNGCSIITLFGDDGDRDFDMDRNICPSEKSAEAHLAMIQLEQLRDCWRQGWKPTEHNTGHCITHYPEGYSIMSFCFISFLSFQTRKIAEEFLECFRDLIEKAGDLI